VSGGLVFPVSSEKISGLRHRMLKLGIREEDLHETFVTSQGKGGQNVNKVATCVVLFHAPSGLRIKCQQERSQGLNRYIARKLLADKIEEAKLGAESKRVQERERIRRQKRRRSRRAKNRMLDDKHARSATKNLRGKVGRDGGD
jgi:protein subunit release factor B